MEPEFIVHFPSSRPFHLHVRPRPASLRTANERRQKSNDSVRMCAPSAGIHPSDRLSAPSADDAADYRFCADALFPVFSPGEDGTPLKHTSRWYRYCSSTTGSVCRAINGNFLRSNCTILLEEWLWPSNEDRLLSLQKKREKKSLSLGSADVSCVANGKTCMHLCAARVAVDGGKLAGKMGAAHLSGTERMLLPSASLPLRRTSN